MKDNSSIWIPGSKSQSIRALLIAAFSKGKSIIKNPLLSSDTLSTKKALEDLGVKIEYSKEENCFYVDSRVIGEGFESVTLDLGNSGTGTYLLLGLAASLKKEITIVGDESLSSRPVGPLCEAYRALGAKVESNNGYLPLTIKGPLKGGKAVIECRTSQYLSSLLLAAVLSEDDVEIYCPLLYEKPYVSMTLSWLDREGISYEISEDLQESRVKGRQSFKSGEFSVSGDYSSASFFFVLAAIHNITLDVLGLDKNECQGDKRILEILEKMGCTVTWIKDGVRIKGTECLLGGTFDINDMPDALPILSVAGCFAKSPLKLTNVPQARIKETDRIKAMHDELEKLGAKVEEEEDGIIISDGSHIHGAKVNGYKDHRIIMALSVLGTRIDGVEIDSTEHVNVTFPTFFSLLNSLED